MNIQVKCFHCLLIFLTLDSAFFFVAEDSKNYEFMMGVSGGGRGICRSGHNKQGNLKS